MMYIRLQSQHNAININDIFIYASPAEINPVQCNEPEI